jgi:serine/threonine protein kinase
MASTLPIILLGELKCLANFSKDYEQIFSAIHNNTDVIVKVFNQQSSPGKYDATLCINEINMMQYISSKTPVVLPKLIGHYIGVNGPSYIVMEKFNLNDAMYYIDNKILSASDSLVLIQKVTLAIHQLHTANIVHRDIKAENILVEYKPDEIGDNRIQVVIIDFGFSTVVKNKELLHKRLGTVPLYSPELLYLNHVGYIGKANDIWSLGVFIYAAMSEGFLPNYSHSHIIKKYYKSSGIVKNDKFYAEQIGKHLHYENIPQPFVDVLKKIFVPQAIRIDSGELLNMINDIVL